MIRTMNPSDLDTVLSIWLASNLDAHPFVDPSYWREQLPTVRALLPQADVYLEEDGEIRGFIGLTGDHIAGLFVGHPYRGQGIGHRLLHHVQQLHPSLTLDVYEANERAVRFYQREGFCLLDRRIDPDSGAYEYHMAWQKPLGSHG